MPRKKTIIIPENHYLWVAQSSQGQIIFRDKEDRETYRRLVKIRATIGNVTVTEITIGYFEVSMCLIAHSNEITNFTRWVQGVYGQYFCKKYVKTGQIWRSHPKCLPIDKNYRIHNRVDSVAGYEQVRSSRSPVSGFQSSPGLELFASLMTRNFNRQLRAIDNYLFYKLPD